MREDYDVIIIGAGIGGLVCGCYLAKAGLKVLIVEQHYKPGGYCTSFERKGYRFDVGVHYLGACRDGGSLNRILKELCIIDKLTLIRSDICDRIIMPDNTVFIYKDLESTKKEFIGHFPREKENIERFFKFILNTDFFILLSKTKHLSFKNFLDSFFYDEKLKAILSVLLGNLGVAPSHASALASVIFYKEYIFDPGYYPQGGIDIFPQLLVAQFQNYGGEILLSKKVKKVITKNKKIIGVNLDVNEFIESKVVISNADAVTTFQELLDCECKERYTTEHLQPSPSGFVVYLGINKNLKSALPHHFTTWYFTTYDVEKCYSLEETDPFQFDYIICSFPSLVDSTLAPHQKTVIRILIECKYNTESIWRKKSYKECLAAKALNRLNEFFPSRVGNIEVMEIATPYTFYHYTSNHKGALFGWSSTVNQIDRNILPPETSVKNLYLTGHWCISGMGQGGITQTALSGKYTAKAIIREILT